MDATSLALALTATIVGAGTAAAIAATVHTAHLAPKLADPRRMERIRRRRHRQRPQLLYTPFIWDLAMWDDGRIEVRLR